MPFQSEKQRRYLHANHPEIAQRWERDYANGGISNHFRRKFFTGALADTQGPAGGQAMSPGTSTTGGSRNLGGGGGNGGTGGNGPKPHSGPTLAEIAAAKAAAEAEKRAVEAAAMKKHLTDFKTTQKKKVNWAQKNWEDIKAMGTVPYNFAKGVFGNITKPGEVTQVTLTDAMKEDLINKAKEKGTLTGNIDYTAYNTPTKTFTGLNKFMDPMDIANALTMGGTGFKTDESGNIELTGGAYDFNKDNVITNFIDQGGMTGLAKKLGAEKIGEKIYDWTAAKGGVARKNYFHGGILDINESEEIISDDGNDIELTAYNAAFDDPNDLSTGVKSLFQAKDGGRIGFANGPPGGGATSLGSGRDYSGSDRGPRDAPDRHGPTTDPTPSDGGMGAKEQYIQTQYTSPEAIAAKTRRELREIVETGPGSPIEKYDTAQQHLADTPGDLDFKSPQHNRYKSGLNVDYRQTAYEQSLANQKAKLKSMGLQKLGRLGIMLVAFLAMGVPLTDALKALPKTISVSKEDMTSLIKVSLPVGKAKKELIEALENHKGGLLKDVDITNPNEMVNLEETTDFTKTRDQLTELTTTPEDDTGDSGPELPPQLGGPSTEEMATEYPTDWLGAIREKQAQKKAYDEKIERERLAREENPIVGTTEMDIIALGNSGGLANLFRVKNQ